MSKPVILKRSVEDLTEAEKSKLNICLCAQHLNLIPVLRLALDLLSEEPEIPFYVYWDESEDCHYVKFSSRKPAEDWSDIYIIPKSMPFPYDDRWETWEAKRDNGELEEIG